MSSALYSTRLWWYGHGGGAKLHGNDKRLTEAPVICGRRVVSIDYVPEIGLQTIQFVAEMPRDMTHDEVTDADVVLRGHHPADSEW